VRAAKAGRTQRDASDAARQEELEMAMALEVPVHCNMDLAAALTTAAMTTFPRCTCVTFARQ